MSSKIVSSTPNTSNPTINTVNSISIASNNKLEDMSSKISLLISHFVEYTPSTSLHHQNSTSKISESYFSQKKNLETVFETNKKPQIGLDDYIYRFVNYGDLDSYTLLAATILFVRVTHQRGGVTPNNVYTLVAGLLFIAFKLTEDCEFFSVHDFALMAGLSSEKLLQIEEALVIDILNFDCLIKAEHHMIVDHYFDKFSLQELYDALESV